MSDLAFLSISEAAARIKSRSLSPVEYVSALLARAEQLQPQLHPYIAITAQRALNQAQAAESEISAGRYRGPLHGIPFGLKDLYDVEGLPTTGGSRTRQRAVAGHTAPSVSALLDAGAILMGKLHTHEFAHGGPSHDLPWPAVRNPWNPEHVTGGSSSGSAAALAAGLLPASLGTDTGGSIRGPSSYCGTTGLMPTFGLVSNKGVLTNSPSFDRCGPMARSAYECALILDALLVGGVGNDGMTAPRPPPTSPAISSPLAGMRIGVLRHFWEEDIPASPEQALLMEDAIKVLRGIGANIEDCRMPPVQDCIDTKIAIAESELFAECLPYLRQASGSLGRDFLGRVLPACLFQGVDYAVAKRIHAVLESQILSLYKRFDVLLTIGFGPAPKLADYRSTSFWRRPNVYTPLNLSPGPVLGLPNGFINGLPVGMQIAGRPFDDATVLRVGRAYQTVTSWHTTHPQSASVHIETLTETANQPVAAVLDDAVRDHALRMACHAGLTLNELQQTMLLENVEPVLAMKERQSRLANKLLCLGSQHSECRCNGTL